jgi:prophage tail gpP-like protein
MPEVLTDQFGNTPVDSWRLEHSEKILDEFSSLERFNKLANTAKCGGSLVLAKVAPRQTNSNVHKPPPTLYF